MENSAIEWTDHTFNPWRGCTKVSPGCANCYAEALSKRTGHGEYKRGVPRERMSAAYWKQPIKWNSSQFAPNLRPRVFCASLSDWLDDEVPIEWLADLLKLIQQTPNLNWLLLTKRPENWRPRMDAAGLWFHKNGHKEMAMWVWYWVRTEEISIPPPHVWVGTTVENQEYADKRIPELLKIPAKIRFLSCEPLLGGVSLQHGVTKGCSNGDCFYHPEYKKRLVSDPEEGGLLVECICSRLNGIHWVICGGESGPKKRPMDLQWARSLKEQCATAGVSFFMKQIDKVQPIPEDLLIRQFPH